jgi:hypothetical protein
MPTVAGTTCPFHHASPRRSADTAARGRSGGRPLPATGNGHPARANCPANAVTTAGGRQRSVKPLSEGGHNVRGTPMAAWKSGAGSDITPAAAGVSVDWRASGASLPVGRRFAYRRPAMDLVPRTLPGTVRRQVQMSGPAPPIAASPAAVWRRSSAGDHDRAGGQRPVTAADEPSQQSLQPDRLLPHWAVAPEPGQRTSVVDGCAVRAAAAAAHPDREEGLACEAAPTWRVRVEPKRPIPAAGWHGLPPVKSRRSSLPATGNYPAPDPTPVRSPSAIPRWAGRGRACSWRLRK